MRLGSILKYLPFIILALPADSRAKDQHAVYHSLDRGRTWTRADTGLNTRSRINAFTKCKNQPIAGTDEGLFIYNTTLKTWQAANVSATSVGRVLCLSSFGDRIYAGTAERGLLISTDAGQSWHHDSSLRSSKIRSLFILNQKVFAGTDADGVWQWSAERPAWAPLRNGLPEHSQIFALTAVQGRLFAGLYAKGLFAFSESTNRWEKVGTVKPLALSQAQNVLIAGHNPGGLHWSADSGVIWDKGVASQVKPESSFSLNPAVGDLPAEAPVWEMASDGTLAIAGAAAGIYISEDGGRTWKWTTEGLPSKAPGIAFLVTSDGVWAAVAL